jgi:hypothetical protein
VVAFISQTPSTALKRRTTFRCRYRGIEAAAGMAKISKHLVYKVLSTLENKLFDISPYSSGLLAASAALECGHGFMVFEN